MFSQIIEFFVKHRTAANLIMIIMIIVGGMSASRLNKQFFPSIDVEVIGVSVEWSGATAEDVDNNVVQPLEPELRTIANVKKVMSSSYEGLGIAQIEFVFGADMQKALADVEAAVGLVEFPQDSEAPEIVKGEFFDTVSRLVLYGPYSLSALRYHAKLIKEDLLQGGVDKVELLGLPDEEIRIEIREAELARLGLTLSDISKTISGSSVDVPAGRFADGALRVRSIGLRKTAAEYEDIIILVRADGSIVKLGEVATLTDTIQSPAVLFEHKGQPAVEIHVMRGQSSDSLETNKAVQAYISEKMPSLPQGLKIEQYNVQANLISERIWLMIENGGTGLILVLLVLFAFLPWRVAFWVATGIPVAFLATFGVMFATGQSINMISLFGLIMALGIVVDDAIVIGEHAEHLRRRRNLKIEQAAILSAIRMGPPVISAMLTTVAAFLPLFTIKGIIGVIIGAIPAVVCAVLLASLIECFLILPAHLAHSGADRDKGEGWFRRNFDKAFAFIRDRVFGYLVSKSYQFRYATMALALGMLLTAVGMMSSGRVGFVFFSAPEADNVYANVTMTSGSTTSQTQLMLAELERALNKVESELTNGRNDLVSFSYGVMGAHASAGNDGQPTGGASDTRAGLMIELITADQRDIRVNEFIDAMRDEIQPLPGLERLTVRAPEGGPPGRELDIRLLGDDLEQLKAASQEIILIAAAIPGTSDIEDNLDYGAEERIIRVSQKGRSIGFTAQSIGTQVRAALDGAIVRRFPRGDEVVTVRLSRASDEVATDTLSSLRLITPQGNYVSLGDVATIENRLGFSIVRRQDGFREVAIQGELDDDVINTSQAREVLESGDFGNFVKENNIRYRFDGRDQEQGEAFADMASGGVLALLCMYAILAWVFASWTRPFAVMVMIPFGLIGAVVGHYAMGLNLNILSLFALIALSGIVVNNSIILVATIERRMQEIDGPPEEAIIQGTVDRLRPVLLTSMTTIGGLSTLMFETSLQAQFLIPMATTIVFGLAVTTSLVLFLVPATLGIGQDLHRCGGFIGRLLRPVWKFFTFSVR